MIGVTLRAADPEERMKLHRPADDPAIATMAARWDVGGSHRYRASFSALPGPFASVNEAA
jgi:hypothetical protein